MPVVLLDEPNLIGEKDGELLLWTWDSNDVFRIDGTNALQPGFEAAIVDAWGFKVNQYDGNPPTLSTFNALVVVP